MLLAQFAEFGGICSIATPSAIVLNPLELALFKRPQDRFRAERPICTFGIDNEFALMRRYGSPTD
jgi:hypothetical protein